MTFTFTYDSTKKLFGVSVDDGTSIKDVPANEVALFMLAKLVFSGAKLSEVCVFFGEPGSGMDSVTREALEQALSKYAGVKKTH